MYLITHKMFKVRSSFGLIGYYKLLVIATLRLPLLVGNYANLANYKVESFSKYFNSKCEYKHIKLIKIQCLHAGNFLAIFCNLINYY